MTTPTAFQPKTILTAAQLNALMSLFSSDANGITFTQAGAGAAQRTVQDKEREMVSVKDYKNNDGTYVAGDGSQNDTTGILAAMAAFPNLHWPTGIYMVDPDQLRTTAQTLNWEGTGRNYPSTGGGSVIRARSGGVDLLRAGTLFSTFGKLLFDGAGLVTYPLHIIPTTVCVRFDHVMVIGPVPDDGSGSVGGSAVFLDGGFFGSPSQIEADFTDCLFSGKDTSHKAAVVLRISGSNTLNVAFRKCFVKAGRVLIQFDGGSGAFIDEMDFSDWGLAANYINGGGLQSTTWRRCYTEANGTFLTGSGSYAGGVSDQVITLEKNQIQGTNNTIALYCGQPIMLVGNVFSQNVSVLPTTQSDFVPPVSIGNRFLTGFDFVGANAGQVVEIGDYFGASAVTRRNALENLKILNAFTLARTAPTYGTSVAINAALGNEFDITATNGTGFTVANPTNPTDGQRITITIRNTSGGSLGTVTWDTLYKLASWTSPATANSRSIDFKYNGSNWVEVSRTPADVPN